MPFANFIKNNKARVREMTQQLRSLTTTTNDLGSVPSTHMVSLQF